MKNKKVISRTDLATSYLTANGGVLSPEQANLFIDMVTEEPTIVKQMRVVRMNAPQRKINRLGFGSRIMRAAPQGTQPFAADDGTNDRYLAAADRSAPTTSQIMLTTKEIMAEVHLNYETLEDNIERGSFEAHVMRLIAEQAALDLEEWALLADTSNGADAYLALNDGLLVSATSNVSNNASAGISPDVFQAGLLAMPQKYLRNRTQLKNFITVADAINYRANVAKRATGYGDSSLTSNNELMAYGIRVEEAPLMPTATGLFTFPKNMIMGIQRNISVEVDRDIRSRQIIIVLTMRVDVKWDDENAVVKYTNI